MNDITLIIYIFYAVGVIIVSFNINIPKKIYGAYIALILFFTLKWIFNYRNCTISYIEYRLRNSIKENCILYNFLENLMEIRNNNHIVVFYILGCFLLYDYFIKKNNKIYRII
jgi:hypothetical protein